MKTRSGKNNDKENLQDLCVRRTSTKSKNSKVHINTSATKSDVGVVNGRVLRERTNLCSFKPLCVKSRDISPPPIEEIRGRELKVLRSPVVTRKKNNLTSHSSQVDVSQREQKKVLRSPVVTRKKNNLTSHSSQVDVSQREKKKVLRSPIVTRKKNNLTSHSSQVDVSQREKKKVLRSPIVTRKKNNLTIHSSHIGDSQHSSRCNSTVKRCVYTDILLEERQVNDKESVYEFVVDKDEPPSRRRRCRKKRVNINPKRCPRKRVHSAFEESLAASSSVVPSSLPSSCFTTSVGGNLSFKEAVMNDNVEHPAATPVLMSIRQGESSLLHPIGTPPTPPTVISSCRNRDTSVPVYKNPLHEVPSNILSLTTKCPNGENSMPEKSKSIFIADRVANAINIEPPGTPSKSGLCESSLLSEVPSICIAMAKHHSTPCKSRSSSDSSSYLQFDEQVAPKEDCFGFSSDEDENINDLPSPVHLSPHSRAHRQGLLTPSNAPSRFSPQGVRKRLALKAVAKPLDFGSSKDSLTQNKIKVSKKGQGMKIGERKEGGSSGSEETAVVSSTKSPCDATRGIMGDALQMEGPTVKTDVRALTPVTECLFEDFEEEDKLLKILPPRKSYERSFHHRTRRVVGGGLCLESGDEDDLDENCDVKNTKTVRGGKNSPKFHRRRNKNAAKKEKELNLWASLMKEKFEEVEHFDLCFD